MPCLYLIPTPIAENAAHTIPPYVAEIVRELDTFIVERAKTARHFVKSMEPVRPIQEMIFEEIEPGGHSTGKICEAARTVFREAIAAGKSVGLLSEAGCPGIADPGAGLVAMAHQDGVRVVPLVGPSSLLLAIMASGMNGQSFTFHGYLSPKRLELARDLRRLEQTARQNKQTQLFIETPYRSQMVLETALESLSPDTRFAVAQDITGAGELIRSLPISMWKKGQIPILEKLPAVFLVG